MLGFVPATDSPRGHYRGGRCGMREAIDGALVRAANDSPLVDAKGFSMGQLRRQTNSRRAQDPVCGLGPHVS
jgi:hypothetical protein